MKFKAQAAIHITLRTISALVSIAVFAKIIDDFPPEEARAILFFSFTTGFQVALLRGFCSILCNLSSASTKSERHRRVRGALRAYIRVLPALILTMFLTLLIQDVPVLVCAVGALIVTAAGLDTDLLRAAADSPPRFSAEFALGTSISLGTLFFASGSWHIALLAILAQWTPVLIGNLLRIKLILRRQIKPPKASRNVRPVLPALMAATFDGAILNFPFIFNIGLGPTAALELSTAIRIFASSLPLQPLIAHWANAGYLRKVSEKHNIEPSTLFFLLSMLSSLIASAGFYAIYVIMRQGSVDAGEYGMFVILLFSYCAYATTVRYHLNNAILVPKDAKLINLGIGAAVIAMVLFLIYQDWQNHAVVVVLIQGTLLAGAATILFVNSGRGN